MGLFSKKVCDICGDEIGLLGNKKLADGNLCKHCAEKLSPYFDDRRNSTVEEIARQLRYREENAKRLVDFHPTLMLGMKTKIYLDEEKGAFLVSYRNDWRVGNPDIISLNSVVDCTYRVIENRSEVKDKTPEGRYVSYNPPRYTYSYQFLITIAVDTPWFQSISFELTDVRPKNKIGQDYREYDRYAREICQIMKEGPSVQVEEDVTENTLQAGQWKCECGQINTDAFCTACGARKPVPAADSNVWKCACGHTNTTAFCTECGAKKPEEASLNPEEWKCECGHINKGKFCTECGKPRPIKPAVVAKRFCTECGYQVPDPSNPPRFCPNCGKPFTA